MATGLNIHIDKENATPSFVPSKGGKGLFSQATPRKALYDVNKDMTRPLALKSTWNEGFTKPSADTYQPARKKTITPMAHKKESHKKLSMQKNQENIQKKEVNPQQHPTSSKASKPKKKVKKPEPVFDEEDDGFDSDTIWPRAERLSSHLTSILAWRPSCFVGNDHDSDLDLSLSDGEMGMPEQIIIGPPKPDGPFESLPDIDMASMLADLPDPEKP
ncbi:hypothetical protein EGW08_012676 [Elysia chlorotica]|uniref:Uncharacterized protein n=1 Tax=Elysia chlorotica TaxID=188477 RepID=A0A3S1BFG8_ELYCH|nr:hypothetical protein EGW08_012676 [Elysia chlorotica]